MAIMMATGSQAFALSFPSVGDLEHGTLIKSSSSSAVYYFGMDDVRYGFPNEATYFTWYDDFKDVKTISVSQMNDIPFGGMVTYKPQLGNGAISTHLLKLASQPTVYVPLAGGMLAALKNESNAITLFGSSWSSHIDILPDALASSYLILGGFLSTSVEFLSDNGYTIADDKSMTASLGVMMYEEPLRFAGYDEAGTCKITGACCNLGYCGFNMVKVDQGNTIKFVNYTNQNLTVREEDGLWTTGEMAPGDIVVVRINSAKGTYNFRADESHSMTGVLVVE
ncbi:MAG: hypothetical protein UU46_C0010G0005 [Candidatus Uhrbacteria bacterium GW2011_GWD1_41_16]|nr:MAG: hypothetical protein UU46_C0010G0005 [Candidatus Uhrbacteria bacterium GW2011_GWD1_41_16]